MKKTNREVLLDALQNAYAELQREIAALKEKKP